MSVHGDTVQFHLAATGASVSINSTEFYVCHVCGACVIEMHRGDPSRNAHTEWHRQFAERTNQAES